MKNDEKKITDSDKLVDSFKELKIFTLKEFYDMGLKTYPEFYDFSDSKVFSQLSSAGSMTSRIYDLDKLLAKDKLREKDGFPRKIKLGKIMKPSEGGKDQTVVIPTTTEEKFYHWTNEPKQDEGPSTGGTGEEGEGEVIGEQPLRPGGGEGVGAGQGEAGEHGTGADAYEVGRVLTEQFELPNIQDKGKKTSLTKYTYDLTDKNRGHGQILDKKSTLKRIIGTNMALGRLGTDGKVDTTKMLINPADNIYKILSKEKDYESQAVVFFVRDYSGSMHGKPTEAVVTLHVYINSWLVYQYNRQVISRFIVHDTEAEEVPDFYTYYNKNVAGGTDVSSAFKLVNKIVEEENLASAYNIYVFHGTDGDDWESNGEKTLKELNKIFGYASRVGLTIAENTYTRRNESTMERYIKKSGILEEKRDLFHMDSFKADEATEERLVQGIKNIISP